MSDYWLRKQVTLAEARQQLSEMDRRIGHQQDDEFNQWVAEHYQTGDELWWYDLGEIGIAIVRGGETAYMFPVGWL